MTRALQCTGAYTGNHTHAAKGNGFNLRHGMLENDFELRNCTSDQVQCIATVQWACFCCWVA